ncbi:MAG: hypothetical protein Kow00121_47600 [Elainellaceae cyanobacterium]
MADLLSPSPGLNSDPILSRESNLDLEAAFSSHSAVTSQIVLKLETAQHTPPPEVDIAPAVLTAFQCLVNLITQLRSPAGGWTEEQPPTPETLAPYVQDEVQDLLDTLNASYSQTRINHSQPALNQFVQSEASFSQRGFLWLKSITDWLLWGIARSSDHLMRLMEGCSATCTLPNQEAQTGILRLVPLLELQTPTVSYRLDLATDQLDVRLLPDEAIVQLDTRLCPEPSSVASLISRLSEQSQLATPTIAAFFQGIWVEALIPHHHWQSGTLQLYFGLGFTPDVEFTKQQPSPKPTPTIQFTDADWVKQYVETIMQQRLVDALSTGVNWQTLTEESTDLTLPSSLIALAYHMSHELQTSLTIASRHLLNPPLGLDELTSRLHWCLLHSAYEIMQLMSGISVQWLQPRSQPQAGILRLAFLLHIQTSNQTWKIDLVTGRSLEPDSFLTESTAVVQSQECSWCESLLLLEQLEKQVWQHINQHMPEIWYLVQGADISAQVDGQDWQPGTLQLQGGFQFTPLSLYGATRSD